MDTPFAQDWAHGITTIDTGYMRPKMVASHLMIENGHAVFIDTGTTKTLPRLLKTLQLKKIPLKNVDFVIVTHVHLDHAGGAGSLMQRCPNAQLVVHPRGARHLIDPSRLIAATMEVYGEKQTLDLYGELPPIESSRIIQASDELELDFQGRSLTFWDTPGHANHHFCILDEKSKAIFTGDTYGLSYREFDTDNGIFIFPTTTPTQFDPGALQASMKRLVSYQPEKMYLTHFGEISHPASYGDYLLKTIDDMVNLVRESSQQTLDKSVRHQLLKEKIFALFLRQIRVIGSALSEERCRELLVSDIELNAQGLEFWWDKTQAIVK
jgi:glyoxylase-like metal-dependent hydrolase (beta-lactamase superfamily II)